MIVILNLDAHIFGCSKLDVSDEDIKCATIFV